ncbi:MAG: hypothetical protein LBH42_07650 [Treponema sp.]|nr:hypothetical protein [Treponema sp.]
MKKWQVNFNNIVHNDYDGLFSPSEEGAEIEFPDLNRRIVTVYIDTVFINDNKQNFRIAYGNEEHSNRSTAEFTVIKGVEETKYVTLQTYGKVSFVKVIYGSGHTNALIKGITLNNTVPLKIFWPRLLLFSAFAFCTLVIKRKKLFSMAIRQDSLGQNLFSAGIIVSFLIYLFILMVLTEPFSTRIPFWKNFANEVNDQYNAYVVDAFLSGQVHLRIQPTKELLELHNPYDPAARSLAEARYRGDHVFYNGKYYSYFGIVQVLVLALPYKLITGNYIPTRIAIFIFSALASIFLILLWRRLVFRFMKDMPLGMFMLGQLAVAMCSMLTFNVTFQYFYSVAIMSAMFFVVFGIWLILGSIRDDKTNRITLTAGCLCMALAVGCRPTSVFVSLLVPVLLFGEVRNVWRDKRRLTVLCACVAVPYILVASGLMWYNYVRFDSAFEFGANYQLTSAYIKAHSLLNPMGILLKIFTGLFCYLFSPYEVRASFPFVFLIRIDINLVFKGYIFFTGALGVFSLPLTWPLFGIGEVKKIVDKKRRLIFHLIVAMICVSFFHMTAPVLIAGMDFRYQVEFFWLFVFSGLICAYFLYEKLPLDLRSAARKIICTGTALSIVLIFLLTLSSGTTKIGIGNIIWNNNPAASYHIQRLLGFNTW